MKVKQMLGAALAVGLAASLIPAFGETVVSPRDKEAWAKLTPAERKAAVEYRLGGMCVKPGSQTGRIALVNAQKRVPADVIRETCSYLAEKTNYRIEVTEGEFSFPKPKPVADVNVYVVDDANLPGLLHAPEERWTTVNVAPLAEGQGAKESFLKARTQKEVTRAFLLACGAQDSNYPNSIMGAKTKPADLDKHVDCRFAVDILRRLGPYLEKFGVRPAIRQPYRVAVQQGWAAAPTNDMQKAIWDKIHAMPTEPIKIKPEAKKVKE